MSETVNTTEKVDLSAIVKKFEDTQYSAFTAIVKEKYAALAEFRRHIEDKRNQFVLIEEKKLEEEKAKVDALKEPEETEKEVIVQAEEVVAAPIEESQVFAEEKTRISEFEDIIVRPAPKVTEVFPTGNITPIIKTANSSMVNRVTPVRNDRSAVTASATTNTSEGFSKKKPLPEKSKQSIPAKVDDRKKLNKKAKIQKGYEESNVSVEYDDSGEVRKIRTRKQSVDKKKYVAPAAVVIDHAVINTEEITIKQLCEKIGKPSTAIIKKLFDQGILKNINDTINFDVAEYVSAEFGVTLELQLTQTSEDKLFAFHEDDTNDDVRDLQVRPPIVTIMGHVDHGKTSILDYIRKANVASGEAGGITQHIGAYTISLDGAPITFIDTPGHAAFTAMRARGANITDIVVIVVAADDGIMPQTIEAINHAKAANVSIIVAINKMDKPTANPDRILQQLTEYGLLVEDWGGTVPAIRVSAKTGEGIKDLLENILITAEVMELKANPSKSAKGTVIEARLDKGKGPVATILVQNGTLKTGDFLVAGTAFGKVRAMFDDKGRQVAKATPSIPVSVLGLQDVPNAGDQMLVVNDEKLSKQVVEERKNREKAESLKIKKVTLDDVFNKIKEGQFKELNLIIKADVQGSVEALKASLLRLSNEEVKVNVIHDAVGAINESDIMLADTAKAIVIGFNIRPDTNARIIAERNGIEIKLYRIIYDVIDDITKAITGLLAPKFEEVYYGRAEVRQIYKVSGVGTIAGCYVKDGKIIKNAKVRVIRDGKDVFTGVLASLKRFKDDAKEVQQGFECGLMVENFNDIKEDDVVEAFGMEEIKE